MFCSLCKKARKHVIIKKITPKDYKMELLLLEVKSSVICEILFFNDAGYVMCLPCKKTHTLESAGPRCVS